MCKPPRTGECAWYSAFMVRQGIHIACVCVALVLIVVFFVIRYEFVTNANSSFQDLDRCFSRDYTSGVDPRCLRVTLRTLLHYHSARDIGLYVTDSDSPSTITSSCHVIGHVLGQELVLKTNSLETALVECPQDCNGGCVHGAIGAEVRRVYGEAYPEEDIAHASLETIASIGAPYCQNSRGLCHGIGHVLFLAGRDFDESLVSCIKIATGELQEACFRGVFMEGFGGVLSLDFNEPSVTVTQENYVEPCMEYDPQFAHSCFRYLPALHARSKTRDMFVLQLGMHGCATLTDKVREYCFEGLGYYGGTVTEGERKKTIEDLCLGLSYVKDQRACINGRVQKYIFYNNEEAAQQVCDRLTPVAEREKCGNTLQEFLQSRGESE